MTVETARLQDSWSQIPVAAGSVALELVNTHEDRRLSLINEISQGRSNEEAAKAISVAAETAKGYTRHLRIEHDVPTTTGLVRLLYREGMLPPLDPSTLPEAPAITKREIEVLDLLAEGHSNKVIAKKLIVSVETVKSHVRHLTEKLDAGNRFHIVRIALDLGLIE